MDERKNKTVIPGYDPDRLFTVDLPTEPRPGQGGVLVTGASGYIGGRLVPELLSRGYTVRVMVRGGGEVQRRRWPEAEVVTGDALNPESLEAALSGVHTAYYLIHSLLLGPGDFEDADIKAADNFRKAAEKNGVSRIIYLGGLGDCGTSRSRHLQCRMAVADELAAGDVPVTSLRAAVIIGSGSASYEIIRHLVSRLPILLIPHWAKNACQPIGVRDVIKYLVGVLEVPETTGRSFDIGGLDTLSYKGMLETKAEVLRRKTLFINSPVSNITLFSYMASLVTPVPAAITSCLMEGLQDEVVCRNEDIRDLVPFTPLSFREAVIRAMTREEADRVHTRWSDAYPPDHELAMKLHELPGGATFTADFSIRSNKDPADLFKSVSNIGGRHGWFQNNWMWWSRGALDRLLFGVGSARGRKSHSQLSVNDVIDFWRVEDLREDERLLLRAEMKLPGKAWLEFEIEELDGESRLSVTPYFWTKSLFGRLYWYFFLPFHHFIFTDLIKQIEARA